MFITTNDDGTTKIENICPLCGKESGITVNTELWRLYEDGIRGGQPAATHGIQVIFSDLSADDRELLLSGTHGPCWDRMFGGDD